MYGRITMKFAMVIEPVCDYRAFLRAFSCSPEKLVPGLADALREMCGRDLCMFELGVPDRNCKVRPTPTLREGTPLCYLFWWQDSSTLLRPVV